MDARDVEFEEDKYILKLADEFANLFSKSLDDLSKEYIESFIKVAIIDGDKAQYIYEETINILKEKYNIDLDNIKI